MEIAIYAVCILDGILKRVHTEDIALKCFELAPDSFSWIKYPEYPDKEVVRSALVDARDKKCGVLLQGRSGKGLGQLGRTKAPPNPDGWMLTAAGVKWIKKNEKRISTLLKVRQPNIWRQELRRKLARLQNHTLFQNYKDQPKTFNPSLGDMAEYYQCRVDSERAVWEKRFSSVRNIAQAADNSSLLAFVEICREAVESQMGYLTE
ncbi:MAG: hypothetical protein HY747_04070 [Elusimicrobia bacterium]|nr:hypothetical protein [Elusimicrobiota bacterium]